MKKVTFYLLRDPQQSAPNMLIPVCWGDYIKTAEYPLEEFGDPQAAGRAFYAMTLSYEWRRRGRRPLCSGDILLWGEEFYWFLDPAEAQKHGLREPQLISSGYCLCRRKQDTFVFLSL